MLLTHMFQYENTSNEIISHRGKTDWEGYGVIFKHDMMSVKPSHHNHDELQYAVNQTTKKEDARLNKGTP